MRRFLAVLKARNLEFIRDRAALSWTIIMPFLLVIAFAFIFSDDNKTLYKVGYFGGELASVRNSADFFTLHHLQFVPFAEQGPALDKLRHHQVDMVLSLAGESAYWINASSSSGYLLERVLLGSGGGQFTKQVVDGKEIRYVDWVLPGILAFNIMFACLFGVGYVIVRYRKSGFLKRLKATPLKAMEFLWAQLVSRLLLITAITLIVYMGSALFIDFTMVGSHLLLFAMYLAGAICMITLGLLVAARISSEELAGGLLNLLTWPMMILSGVWFSLEGTHPIIQKIALLLPLTHLVNGARAIMTEGAGWLEVWPNFAVLLLSSAVFLLIGARVFRWE
ncbi:MAG: ABC transporter [Halothiobacillaceae bacterium]|nr:MAG: ABC transporter [Halothiobacillaceae bacterium]